MTNDLTLEQVQALVTRAPFHQWLGLTVTAVTDDSIEIRAKWREEWVVNTERGYVHGGVLAALIDLAADWAMVKQTGRGVPTIDLRVDYHARRCVAISSHAARSFAADRNSPPPRRRYSMSKENSSPAAAAPTSRRRLRHRSHNGTMRVILAKNLVCLSKSANGLYESARCRTTSIASRRTRMS
jgi:hypothetical protein